MATDCTYLAEEWRTIIAFPAYRVSNLGAVCGVYGKILLPRTSRDGYKFVNLSLGMKGFTKAYFVHALVAEAFIGPRPVGLEVNHKDFDRSNNRASNLEYLTKQQNVRHSANAGRYSIPRPWKLSKTGARSRNRIFDYPVTGLGPYPQDTGLVRPSVRGKADGFVFDGAAYLLPRERCSSERRSILFYPTGKGRRCRVMTWLVKILVRHVTQRYTWSGRIADAG